MLGPCFDDEEGHLTFLERQRASSTRSRVPPAQASPPGGTRRRGKTERRLQKSHEHSGMVLVIVEQWGGLQEKFTPLG